jgi:uncharacterized SAM-binding protein YcdF (DUF218 family)
VSWFITNFIAAFFIPPLNLFLLLILGIFLLNRRPKLARFILISALCLLWLLATPFFAETGLHWLESHAKPLTNPLPDAEAIVILGGGNYFHAPEYGNQPTINAGTLQRLRYGAMLYHLTQRPVLVTGGSPLGEYKPEAQEMRSILEQEFNVPVRWMEDKSRNTFENAFFTLPILQKEGITRIYLVTTARHIPRAAAIFRRAGFTVIEAPTEFTTRYKTDLFSFLPKAHGLGVSAAFTHEMIGLLWYRIKLWTQVTED